MTSIKDILDTMDVPESRKDVREVASIRWLIRNVGVQNSANPQYNDLITQLINLLPDHDRQRNIGLAEVAEERQKKAHVYKLWLISCTPDPERF